MGTMPNVDWHWDRIYLSGNLTTQAQVRALIDVLSFLGERLPPGVGPALTAVTKEDGHAAEVTSPAPADARRRA